MSQTDPANPKRPAPTVDRSIGRLVLAGLSLALLVLIGQAWAGRAAERGGGGGGDVVEDTGYRIAINHAEPATLELLPGVGPAVAANLVRYRQEVGPLRSGADLEAVHLIGPVLRERIGPWVDYSVTPPVSRPSAAGPAAVGGSRR